MRAKWDGPALLIAFASLLGCGGNATGAPRTADASLPHDGGMADDGEIVGAAAGSDDGEARTPEGDAEDIDVAAASVDGATDSGDWGDAGGCSYDGVTYPPYASAPGNECAMCLPGMSGSSWASAPDGTPCSAGVCLAEMCEPGCFDLGTYVGPGQPDPNDPCQTCIAGSSWTVTVCPGAEICVPQYGCGQGCSTGSTFVGPGQPNPYDPCQICEPSASSFSWTNAPDGTPCGTTGTCSGGACVTGPTPP